MDALEKRGDGVWLRVRVQPKASRNSIHVDHDRVRVALTAPPVDGEANDALIAFLAKAFRLPRRSVSLVQGGKSRDKTVCLAGIDLPTAETLLDAAARG